MQTRFYIQVLLPVKLDWNPWYYTDTPVPVGTRVKVRLGHREYVGVVVKCADSPDIPETRVQPVLSVESQLEPVTNEEMELWRFIADYYLCTMGEVFKAAYPAARLVSENRASRKKADSAKVSCKRHLSDVEKRVVISILDSFEDRRPVLLQGSARENVYGELAARTLESGRDVLVLDPGCSCMNPTMKREVSKELRSGKAVLVRSSRTAVFLPFHKLGLVIVDEEQDISYKQDSPAPRYNARDVAIVLASLQGASLLLGSSCPSLESVYNVRSGKYDSVALPDNSPQAVIIDTDAERRKNGMLGESSRKLIALKEQIEAKKKKVFIANSWELGNISKLKLDKYSLVAILHFEMLLSRPDFRADEKALHILTGLRNKVKGILVIQTKTASHPVFSGDVERLMAERKAAGLPPFSRQVAIRNSKGEIIRQAFLPKDRNLSEGKRKFIQEEEQLLKSCTVDVDPV